MDYLASLAPRGWRLGLDRMSEFAHRADLINLEQRFLHVAGTNGKGSVTAYLQHMLVASGYRTGAFFSPFVYEPRERIQLGLELISPDAFAAICSTLRPIEESLVGTEFGGVTEFEMKTAIGLEFWKQKDCEFVALEVGLGGRLDSTNIVTPVVSAIVSIGLDHTAVLGATLGQIAFEKAGVIKPGVPVVIGEVPTEAIGVIEHEADERGSPLWRLGREVDYSVTEQGVRVRTPHGEVVGLRPGMQGEMQPHNVAVAVAMFHAAQVPTEPEAIRDGVSLTQLPGRMEKRSWRGQRVVLDGAHNGEAAMALARSLEGQRFVVIAGMVAGHDPQRFFEPLESIADQVFLAPINFQRAREPAELRDELRLTCPVWSCDSVPSAMNSAYSTGLPILVTGSFYLVGEVGRWMNAGNGLA